MNLYKMDMAEFLVSLFHITIMNAHVVIAFVCLSIANAGLVLPSTRILQGPSTKTTLVGPDGSVISAAAHGGQIVYEEHPGAVVSSGPVVAAPAISHLAYASPILSHSSQADTVVAGPSGTIATGRSFVAGPAAHPAQVFVPGVLEGQYVHDYTENFYDDGSYKPHLY